MRLNVSLVVTVLVAMLLLSACNSNESALPIASNSPSPASGKSTNRPSVGTSTPSLLPSTQSPATAPPSGEEARRITPEELKSKLDSGQAILIDVRGEAAYNQSHIKGSRQIPFAEIAAHADELPRNKLIATYCS